MGTLYKPIYSIEFAKYLYHILEICADMHYRHKCDLLLNPSDGNLYFTSRRLRNFLHLIPK